MNKTIYAMIVFMLVLSPVVLASTQTVVSGRAIDMNKQPGTDNTYLPVPGTSPLDIMVLCKHNKVSSVKYTKLMSDGYYYVMFDSSKCDLGDSVKVTSLRVVNQTSYYSSFDTGIVKSCGLPINAATVDMHLYLKNVLIK